MRASILHGMSRHIGSPLFAWTATAALQAVPWVCAGAELDSRSLVLATTAGQLLWLLFWGWRCAYVLDVGRGSFSDKHC